MTTPSHNPAVLLGWLQVSREDDNARCSPDSPSRASELHPPWLSSNPAARAPLSDWLREPVSLFPSQRAVRQLLRLWPRLRPLRIGWPGVTSRDPASAGTGQSQAWRILQTGEAAAAAAAAAAGTQKIGEKAEKAQVAPRGAWRAAMTTLHTRKDPLLRGVSPTPSKIPVLSQRCPDFSSVKSCSLDQENQDPRRLAQKPPLSTQRPLIDSAGLRPKTSHQTEKSQRLGGITQLRNPLEELKPSSGGPNVGFVPHPQTEATGAIDFVADPAALATILSGEGVKSCPLGRQSSLAQRVLVRGSKGGTTRRGQIARSSAYLAPRTPVHQPDPARASCFSRLEGLGPRGRTLCPQRLEALNPPSGPSFHSSTRPSLQELRRETCGNSRTSASQPSRSLPKTPAQPAEPEAVPHSGEGGRALLGLAQRVPLRETGERTHTRTAYSSLKKINIWSKTHFTPLRSLPRVQQQAQWPSGLSPHLSPHRSPEEPALPWEQIVVKLFDQEGRSMLQKGSLASTSGPHPNKTPNLQELKMQRISVLQQLLRQEIEELAVGRGAPLNGGSALEMTELQPQLAEISRTLTAPEHNSGTSLPGLSKHSGVTGSYLAEEREEPQACPGEETKVVQPSSTTEPEPLVPCWIAGPEPPEPPEPCLPALPGPLLPHSQGQAGPLGACPRIELRPSAACSLEARNPKCSSQACCSQRPPATTSLTFSSQSPLCASPPIHSLQSLRSPAGQSGPSSLAPRTLALRQRLRACLTAIHCFHEARLDDECAFYTSRIPPPGLTRVCTNPVATLLERQDALCFIPVGSVAPQDSPS
ncbi:tastin isoform X2 [Peromyscus californicus insignis]|uniref:tastin isoform X2 n=1 Tax=Peromyscus californicus insignis TaxID=564181 RepID=UPI0022A804F6|nr:tastin isoform X2 [Peromyscus californicus insignis]